MVLANGRLTAKSDQPPLLGAAAACCIGTRHTRGRHRAGANLGGRSAGTLTFKERLPTGKATTTTRSTHSAFDAHLFVLSIGAGIEESAPDREHAGLQDPEVAQIPWVGDAPTSPRSSRSSVAALLAISESSVGVGDEPLPVGVRVP